MNELAIGRIVLVRSPEWEGDRPAIVTQVWSQQTINVNVFGDGSYDDFDTKRITSVVHEYAQDEPTLAWRWYNEEAA